MGSSLLFDFTSRTFSSLLSLTSLAWMATFRTFRLYGHAAGRWRWRGSTAANFTADSVKLFSLTFLTFLQRSLSDSVNMCDICKCKYHFGVLSGQEDDLISPYRLEARERNGPNSNCMPLVYLFSMSMSTWGTWTHAIRIDAVHWHQWRGRSRGYTWILSTETIKRNIYNQSWNSMVLYRWLSCSKMMVDMY